MAAPNTPPQFTLLIEALARLKGDSSVAEKHAGIISSSMIDLITPARGHDIGSDDAGFYARPRPSTGGPQRELRNLRGKARKVIAGKINYKEWIAAWAALPAAMKSRLWKKRLVQSGTSRTIDRSTVAGSFSAPGLHLIAPNAKTVLPAIDAALASIKTVPGSHRQRRKRDEAEQIAITAIRSAYIDLTGYRGGRRIGADGKLTGQLHRLGREVDGIFGTRLFAKKDSRRLREPS